MTIGILTLQLHIPECTSLKQKRGILKPILARLHREFNVSAAETVLNDHWQDTILVCAIVSNDCAFCTRALQTVLDFTNSQWPNIQIIDHRIECL